MILRLETYVCEHFDRSLATVLSILALLAVLGEWA